MKHELKYLKLFEAFESIKLAKTLKFINKESQEHFLGELKSIGNRLDFPISKFSDDVFEYLPFKSALKKNVDPQDPQEKEPCNHESDWIPGEFCQGGLIRRTWGSHIRTVKCDNCNGTGFEKAKPKTPEISLFKFWFDKDGNYVRMTGCDGQIRKQVSSSESNSLHHFSRKIKDYNSFGELDIDGVKGLNTGDIILAKLSLDQIEPCICMIWKEFYGGVEHIYCLHDDYRADGSSPNTISITDRKQYANYSWTVVGGSDLKGRATLLKLKPKKEELSKSFKNFPTFYTWNNTINVYSMTMENKNNMDSILKNAHFAIILDLEKLKSSQYKGVQKTRIERELRKSGAFLTPDAVKTANLERYFNTLITKFNFDKSLSELNKVLPRAFGYANSLTFIIDNKNISNLDDLVSYINNFMQDPGDYYQEQVKNHLTRVYNNSYKLNNQINQKIEKTWSEFDTKYKNIDKKNLQDAKDYFEIYLQLGELMMKKIQSFDIQTLSDIELVVQKLRSFRDFIGNSRTRSYRQLKYVANYLSTSYSVCDQIFSILDDYPNAKSELLELKKLIQNL
jgi:hypothetical protein